MWGQRGELFDFGRHVCWLCRPFTHKSNTAEWERLINRLVRLGKEHGLTLVVIDPLIAFLPGRDENSATAIMAALLPLRRLTAAGMAVLLLHHPRKGRGQDGQLSRGSGALTGHVDILIEWGWCNGPSSKDRRRRLRSFSRFGETIPEQVIELDAAGTDYLMQSPSDPLAISWPGLDVVLTRTRHKMTRPEILEDWPPEHERPSTHTFRSPDKGRGIQATYRILCRNYDEICEQFLEPIAQAVRRIGPEHFLSFSSLSQHRNQRFPRTYS